MKKYLLLLLFCLSCLSSLKAQELSPQQILEKAELVLYPESFFMEVTLTTTSPGKPDKYLKIESYYKRDVGSIMEIKEPKRSAGIRFLQKGSSLWMYNPKARSKKAIRLSPRSSFQGSVFSNNDMGDPQYSDNYNVSLTGTEALQHSELGTVTCYVLEAEAKDESSAYARIIMWVTKDELMPLKMEFYAKSGLLFKQMTLSGIKYMAGRVRPTVITMQSFELEDTVSIVVFENMQERNDLAASMFTQAALVH